MLTSTRNFLLLALIGVLVALVVGLIGAGAGGSDSGPLLLGAMIAGGALTMFSLVPPALRLLLRGWARAGIGPREPGAARRLADLIATGVWTLWLAGGLIALPAAWTPLLATLGMR